MIWTNTTVKLKDLKPWQNNPRQSTKKQAQRILESFDKFGQVQVIAIGPDNEVYDGHQRLSALMTIHGTEYQVDARQCERQLTEAERQALVITLHAGAKGEWDWDTLANWDIDAILGNGMDMEFLKELKSDSKAMELLLKSNEPPTEDAEPQIDRAEELREKWGVELGQMWQLGDHRIICGDCTDKAVVDRVMMGEKAALCLTDPPYGLGDKKASGKNNYDEHEDTQENLISLISGWLPIARELSPVVVFSPGVTNLWLYPQADWVMSWFYGGGQLLSSWGYNTWQPFLCYGKDPSLASGHGGRPDGVDMNTPANADDLDHPCPKPYKLWEWFMGRLSFTDLEIIYEPFSGSGTTIIACENLGRKCRAIEISPAYVAVAIQRWVDVTGKEPVML
jgi:hypothetical protein